MNMRDISLSQIELFGTWDTASEFGTVLIRTVGNPKSSDEMIIESQLKKYGRMGSATSIRPPSANPSPNLQCLQYRQRPMPLR